MNPRTRLWNKVYQTSLNAYTSIPNFGDMDARMTADIAADTTFESGIFGGSPRKRHLRPLARLPKPGKMFRLGAFLELEYVLPSGEIRASKFGEGSGVDLLWSEDLKGLLVLPYASAGRCDRAPTPREKALLAVWAKGRTARCSLPLTFDLPAMPIVFPAIQVSYRSDKFSPGKPRNYIHHIDSRGVLAYFSSEPFGVSRAPKAMLIRGGKLRITPHGIAG